MRDRLGLLRPRNNVATGQAYVLVEGSESSPECWAFLGDVPSHVLDEAKARIVELLVSTFSENPVFSCSLQRIRLELGRLTTRVLENHPEYRAPVVSLSSLYSDQYDFRLDVNRLVDESGHEFDQIGARALSPSIREQVANITNVTSNCIVTDDVLWKGKTLSDLIRLGLRPRAFVTAIATAKAYTAMKKRSVSVHNLWRGEEKELLDSVPLHDFLPFAPLGGVAVGEEIQGRPRAIIREGISFSKPYLLPYLDGMMLHEKASVPQSRQREFSTALLEIAIDFFRNLELTLGRQIAVRDLLDSAPRCSYPLRVGEDYRQVKLDTRIVDKLKQDLQVLS